MSTRLSPEHRRAQIVNAARNLSYGGRLYDWTLTDVATHCDCSESLVKYYFLSAIGLRNEIIVSAIRERDVRIVIQALAKCDPLTDKIDGELRDACADYMRAA